MIFLILKNVVIIGLQKGKHWIFKNKGLIEEQCKGIAACAFLNKYCMAHSTVHGAAMSCPPRGREEATFILGLLCRVTNHFLLLKHCKFVSSKFSPHKLGGLLLSMLYGAPQLPSATNNNIAPHLNQPRQGMWLPYSIGWHRTSKVYSRPYCSLLSDRMKTTLSGGRQNSTLGACFGETICCSPL